MKKKDFIDNVFNIRVWDKYCIYEVIDFLLIKNGNLRVMWIGIFLEFYVSICKSRKFIGFMEVEVKENVIYVFLLVKEDGFCSCILLDLKFGKIIY